MASLSIAAGPSSGTCAASPSASLASSASMAAETTACASGSDMPRSTSWGVAVAVAVPGGASSAGVRRAQSTQSGALVLREVQVWVRESVRVRTVRPKEKKGIDRPSASGGVSSGPGPGDQRTHG